jgi:hypothetical protein
MKKLLIILVLLISGFVVQGQNYLLKTAKDIILTKGEPTEIDRFVTENGTQVDYMAYMNDTKVELYYLDMNYICVVYTIYDTYPNLTGYIKELNKEYIVLDDRTWKYHGKDYIYTARLSGFDDKTFQINFSFKQRDIKL